MLFASLASSKRCGDSSLERTNATTRFSEMLAKRASATANSNAARASNNCASMRLVSRRAKRSPRFTRCPSSTKTSATRPARSNPIIACDVDSTLPIAR